MADIFSIALVNPLRFLPENETDLFQINQQDKCYFQKWITSDSTIVQMLSDFPIIDFVIRDYETNLIILNINVVQKPFNIIGQTFDCYEAVLNFSQLQPGKYFAEISYSGLSDPVKVLLSEPFEVAESWPNTLLFTYTNSENNYDIIFDTNVTFDFRVEGTIKEFTPTSDDVIYNDQLRNATLLDSVPYRTFKLYIGNEPGLPDWVSDKANRVMSCNEKTIDGNYYEKIEGAKWEVVREIEYPFIGMSVEIMPVENLFLQRLKTGTQPPRGFTVVEKVLNFFANAINITITDIFKKYTLLKHVSIINYGSPFTLLIGTTPGGTEIGTFTIPIDASTQNIKILFMGITTVYLTGLTGTNADILLDYLQYDEIPAQPTPSPAPAVGIGMICIYEEPTPGTLPVDFDLGTGLGQVGTDWFGWAICDGRNGTIDRGALLPVGYKDGDPLYGTLQDVIGSSSVTLLPTNIPPKEVTFTFGLDKRGTTGTEGLWSNFGSDGSKTLQVGGDGTAFEVVLPSIVSLWVKKIA